MNYKTNLKRRINELYPTIKIGKIKLCGTSFSIVIKTLDIN